METTAQTCVRLVAALEDLAAEEASCLQARDFEAVIGVQKRAEPLIEFLVRRGPSVADMKLRTRIRALVERRERACAQLATEITRTRRQIDGLQAASRRAAQVVPVYGRTPPPRRQLCAVG